MHPDVQTLPVHSPGVVMARSGEVTTRGQLDMEAAQLAQLWRAAGLQAGDTVLVCVEPSPTLVAAAVATSALGLTCVPVLDGVDARDVARLLTTAPVAGALVGAARPDVRRLVEAAVDTAAGRAGGLLTTGAGSGRWRSYGDTPVPDGADLSWARSAASSHPADAVLGLTGPAGAQAVFLSTAPLSDRAALKLAARVHASNATLVLMEEFDAIDALECIELYRVTHSHWDSAVFDRLLALSPVYRSRYDLSSHQVAAYEPGRCSPATLGRMAAWWGPILAPHGE